MSELSFDVHTIEKLVSWEEYTKDWFNIVSSQKCCIIDCYAGTGYNDIKGRRAKGSSLIAIDLFKDDYRQNFSVILIEKNEKNYQKLISNVESYIDENNLKAKVGSDIKILNTDWKSVINDLINETKGYIRLFFFDSYADKSLPWNNLELLLEKGKSNYGYKESGIEVLLNWPWHAIRRKLGIYYSWKDKKSENPNIKAEIENLDSFFGDIDWKRIANKYSSKIFNKEDRKSDQICRLREELLFEYSIKIFQYFKYVKIHSVHSRKKGKINDVLEKGTVKYNLIFVSNYPGALEIIDKGFKKYRDMEFYSRHQKSLKYFYESKSDKSKIHNETVSIKERIFILEESLGIELFNKNKEIIEFLYEKWTQDYGSYDFVIYRELEIDENHRYLKFLLDNNIIACRTKVSKKGFPGDYYYLIHPILVDRNEYFFYDDKSYLYSNGNFQDYELSLN